MKDEMIEVKPTQEMIEAAEKIGEGPIIFIYNDHGVIRCETETGEDPFWWDDERKRWRRMTIQQTLRTLKKKK